MFIFSARTQAPKNLDFAALAHTVSPALSTVPSTWQAQ